MRGIKKHVTPHTLRQASAYCTTFQSSFILKTIGLAEGNLRKFMGATTCRFHFLLHLRKQQIFFLDDPWRVFHNLPCRESALSDKSLDYRITHF